MSLILSLAVWVTDAVLPGFHVKSPRSALLVAAIFGVLNFILGWLHHALDHQCDLARHHGQADGSPED